MIFGYPYFRPYYPKMNYKIPNSTHKTPFSADSCSKQNNTTPKFNDNPNMLNPAPINKKENPKEDSEILNILGVSLYTDDILIIGLLIFLYIEEVQDPYLFVCLILLLLS